LVSELASRIADALGLPFRNVVRKTGENQPQKQLVNSAQQCRNVWNAFDIVSEMSADPVLLVDDIYDSRWTLTVVGRALRLAGSGPVFPFVLAQAVA
jgi:ATP-dependent DNA helicase RecQ